MKPPRTSMKPVLRNISFYLLLILGSSLTLIYHFGWNGEDPHPPPPPPQVLVEGEVQANFSYMLDTFPWDNFGQNVNDDNALRPLLSSFLDDILPFLIMEPRVKVNSSCEPPSMDSYSCPPGISRYSGNSTPKIGILLQFGFDTDILEIHLRELYDLVDKFFVVESTRTHHLVAKKPLIWERIKGQGRFDLLQDKVVHMVMDESDAVELDKHSSEMFNSEYLQESVRWWKFLHWNNKTGYFLDNDFLGFGDTDEMVSRKTLWELKHCNFSLPDPIDIGLWFPYGNISQAFRSDHPVKGFPYTYGDPTFYRFRTAKNPLTYGGRQEGYPSRLRGNSPTGSFLLGGIHMTHHGYLPFQITKRLAMTEARRGFKNNIEQVMLNKGKGQGGIRALELEFAKSEAPSARLVPLEKVMEDPKERMKEIAILPWFYDCNRGRFPTWEGGHDTRLD